MTLDVARVPVLTDNYVWLMHDDASGADSLAALTVVAVPGTSALTIELRDLNDSVRVGPVLMLRVGTALTPSC